MLSAIRDCVDSVGAAIFQFSYNFPNQFYLNFIKVDRWKYLWDGLKVTLTVTVFAALIGILLGFIVAIIRATHDKTGKLSLLNVICTVYLTVIRGTPVLVQLLIIYFVIFGSVRVDKVFVAVVAFGINSGAYVAEIIRGGIMSIDANKIGKAASKSNVVGSEIFLFHGNDNPTQFDPGFAKTFSIGANSVENVRMYREERNRSDILAVDWSEDVQVVSAICAKRITVS